MSPSRLKWGVLLILIGGTFLAINLGYLSWWVWMDILYLWPVLLIAIGLEVILKKTNFQSAAYISTLLVIGCFVWAISEDGGLTNRRSSFGRLGESDARLDYHNEKALTLSAEFEDGRFYFNSGDSELLRVSGGGSKSRVAMTSDCKNEQCAVELKNEDRRMFRRAGFSSTDNYWKCYLHPDVEGTLKLRLDEADLRLFAEDLMIRSIDINAIQSDILVKLGLDVPQVEITLDGRSTDVDLILPDSIGIRIEGSDLREPMLEIFKLSYRDGAYTNDLYNSAAVKVNVVSKIDNGRLTLSSYQTRDTNANSI